MSIIDKIGAAIRGAFTSNTYACFSCRTPVSIPTPREGQPSDPLSVAVCSVCGAEARQVWASGRLIVRWCPGSVQGRASA